MRNAAIVVIIGLAISAIACGQKDLSYAEKEHQKQIETSLKFSERGWLVEASDGVVYKVQDITYHSEVSYLELIADARRIMRVTVGRGDCLRCTAYFARVVTPSNPDYAGLAVQYARQ
jgi:hypothetical protein